MKTYQEQKNIAIAYEQGNYETMALILKQMSHNDAKKCLSKLFKENISDDATRLESLLAFVVVRERIPLNEIADYYDLYFLAMTNNKQFFEYLVSISINIDKYRRYESDHTTLLREACRKYDVEAVKILLKHGADVNEMRGSSRNSVLYDVTSAIHETALLQLIEANSGTPTESLSFFFEHRMDESNLPPAQESKLREILRWYEDYASKFGNLEQDDARITIMQMLSNAGAIELEKNCNEPHVNEITSLARNGY